MQEMSIAWQKTIDMKLGLFSNDSKNTYNVDDDKNAPIPLNIIPHSMWTQVRVCGMCAYHILTLVCLYIPHNYVLV